MSDSKSWRDSDSGDDRLAQLHQAGQQVTLGLFSLMRTAAIHDLNNRALDRSVAQLLEALTPFVTRAHGRFSVVAIEGQIYVDDIRVRMRGQSFHVVGELEALFNEKGVGGLSFDGMPRPGQLRRLAHTINHAVPNAQEDPLEAVRRELANVDVGNIQLTRPVRSQLDSETMLGAQASSQVDTTITYAKAVSALSQLLADPAGRERMRRRHMNHVVREIAECASETLDYLIGLTNHALNRRDRSRLCVDTCVVAIALARSMKLSRNLISDLGVAAMADAVPGTESDREASQTAARSLLDLLRPRRWTASALRRTLISAQRAQPVRGSGGLPDQYHLARIHRVARDYVSLTHGVAPDTLDERDELTPLEALSFLSQSPPSVYDPVVISHLVRVVGLYPIGTLLKLSDGRSAYVVARDDHDEVVVLIRTGAHRFGERTRLSRLGVRVISVASDPDPSERAAAVLGSADQGAVHDVGQQVAEGSKLARVQIHRIAVKRESQE